MLSRVEHEKFYKLGACLLVSRMERVKVNKKTGSSQMIMDLG